MHLFWKVLAVKRLCHKHNKLLLNKDLPVLHNILIKRLVDCSGIWGSHLTLVFARESSTCSKPASWAVKLSIKVERVSLFNYLLIKPEQELRHNCAIYPNLTIVPQESTNWLRPSRFSLKQTERLTFPITQIGNLSMPVARHVKQACRQFNWMDWLNWQPINSKNTSASSVPLFGKTRYKFIPDCIILGLTGS